MPRLGSGGGRRRGRSKRVSGRILNYFVKREQQGSAETKQDGRDEDDARLIEEEDGVDLAEADVLPSPPSPPSVSLDGSKDGERSGLSREGGSGGGPGTGVVEDREMTEKQKDEQERKKEKGHQEQNQQVEESEDLQGCSQRQLVPDEGFVVCERVLGLNISPELGRLRQCDCERGEGKEICTVVVPFPSIFIGKACKIDPMAAEITPVTPEGAGSQDKCLCIDEAGKERKDPPVSGNNEGGSIRMEPSTSVRGGPVIDLDALHPLPQSSASGRLRLRRAATRRSSREKISSEAEASDSLGTGWGSGESGESKGNKEPVQIASSTKKPMKRHWFFRPKTAPAAMDSDTDREAEAQQDRRNVGCKRSLTEAESSVVPPSVSENVPKRPRSNPDKYHPFFNTRFSHVRHQLQKATVLPLPEDAWDSLEATVNIPPEASSRRDGRVSIPVTPAKHLRVARNVQNPVGSFFRVLDKSANLEEVRREPVEVCDDASTEHWAEKYRKAVDGLSTIHAFQYKKLVSWLEKWYTTPCRKNRHNMPSAKDSDSEYSVPESESETEDNKSTEERVVLLTGPVGIGKSTMVYQAAEKLGLNVIEINASSCRTGKRLKEVLGEAMKISRLSSKSAQGTESPAKDKQNNGWNSLLLCEEADNIFDDEKGFWNCIEDLVRAPDCKRPLVVTANEMSRPMQAVFGDLVSEEEQELSYVLRNSFDSNFAESFNYRHFEIEPPTARQLQGALRYIARKEGLSSSNSLIKTLAGIHLHGDLRAAINSLQFWSLGMKNEEQNNTSETSSAASLRFSSFARSDDSPGEAFSRYPIEIEELIHCWWDGEPGLPLVQEHLLNTFAESTECSKEPQSLENWSHHLEYLSLGDCLSSPRASSVDEYEDASGVLDSNVKLSSSLTGFSLASFIKHFSKLHRKKHLQPNQVFCSLANSLGRSIAREREKDPFEAMKRAVPSRRQLNVEYLPTLRNFAKAEEALKDRDGVADHGRRRSQRHQKRLSHFHHLRMGQATRRCLLSTSIPTAT